MHGAEIPAALGRFAEIWCVDFEFTAGAGERPEPLCCVALELRSGRQLRRWGEALREPLPVGAEALYVAYYASAECGCHLALGWPLPANVLDLFAEFRVYANGRDRDIGVEGASLLSALSHFGLAHLDPELKAVWRQRILAGPPYSPNEQVGILDYCASDVHALRELLPRLVARLEQRPHWLAHALLRGRYMRAAARIEHVGIPVDANTLQRLTRQWEPLKRALIDRIRSDYPFFEGPTLKMARFEQWLAERGIAWPRTDSGRLSLTQDVFKEMTRAHPVIAPVREVQQNLAKLRITDLAVGSDGRNRALLSAFRARTGRNQPAASRFIFAPSVWLRSLIQPEPGMALAYVDFSSQEVGIAAALSGDAAMMRAYADGDPYLGFAIDAGLAPADATKASHGALRGRCKAMVLGTLYGMQEASLAAAMGVCIAEARAMLQAHRRTYATFWDWSQRLRDVAMLRGHIDTCFGWRLHVSGDTRPTSLMNHPMQAHGAEMLRLACCLLTEDGVDVCAPVHDAVLIQAEASHIDEAVAHTRHHMARAARIVLGGFEIRTDADVIVHPQRLRDDRGEAMWNTVAELLAGLDGQPRPM